MLAIDPDDYPEFSHWEDAADNWVCGPQRSDEQWLGSHLWAWSRCQMEEVLPGHDRAMFVCDIARNQKELLDLTDLLAQLELQTHVTSMSAAQVAAAQAEVASGVE